MGVRTEVPACSTSTRLARSSAGAALHARDVDENDGWCEVMKRKEGTWPLELWWKAARAHLARCRSMRQHMRLDAEKRVAKCDLGLAAQQVRALLQVSAFPRLASYGLVPTPAHSGPSERHCHALNMLKALAKTVAEQRVGLGVHALQPSMPSRLEAVRPQISRKLSVACRRITSCARAEHRHIRAVTTRFPPAAASTKRAQRHIRAADALQPCIDSNARPRPPP